jgi:hypothetical protein
MLSAALLKSPERQLQTEVGHRPNLSPFNGTVAVRCSSNGVTKQ